MKIQSRESTTPMAFLYSNWFMRDMGYISTIHYGAGESCDSSTENKRTVNEHPASPRNGYHSPILYNDDSWFYESKWRIQLWLFINPPLDSTTQTVLNLYHLALIATFLDMALISMKGNCHLSSDPTANEQLWYRKLGIRVLLPNIQEEKVLDQREDQKSNPAKDFPV